MSNLPSPMVLLEAINNEPHQLDRARADQSLSSHLGGLCINTSHTSRNLPSIHSILNNTPPPDRRLSESSAFSYTSGCSTPPLPHYDWNGNQTTHPWINEVRATTPCTLCGDSSRGVTNQGAGLCSVCTLSTPKPPQRSSTSRRLRQINDPVASPYPTPQNSPVQTSTRVCKPSPVRRSPQHYRYNGSSECTDSSENEKTRTKTKKPRNKKAQREFCGRLKQSGSLAGLQNSCLEVNPNMALLAAPRPDAPNGGWRPLKSNNINKDIENPLFVNKVDVMATSTMVIRQDNMLFSQLIERLRHMGDTMMQARDCLRAPELDNLVDEIELHGLADELAEVVSNRGCIGFRFLGDYMRRI